MMLNHAAARDVANRTAGNAAYPARTSSPASLPSIRIRNLTKRFRMGHGDFLALNDVSMEIGEGEKLVLLGPSGCGKTTLLRCVAGLEQPDEGEIEINGRIVFSSERGVSLPPEARGVSMVFQSYALWPHMTVFDNIAFPLVNIGRPKAEIRERVTEALGTVGCDALSGRYPNQLSGGQQQRIALARSIVAGDGIVLFDEPLSNVDAKVREQLRVELVALQKKLGFTALYVTHDQTEASSIAHRIAVMKSGSVAQIGKPREIYDRPASCYVADFVGASNEIPGRVTGRGNGLLTVSTILGDFEAPDDRALSAGQEVKVMIRPENIRLRPEHRGANHVSGVLESEMFLGLYTEYVLVAEGIRLTMKTMQPAALSDGQAVTFFAGPEHVLVFP